ncbi:MAG: hypothetical protein ACOC80_16960 [Petrotogales bacterium]
MSTNTLKNDISRTIDIYNRYRSPEITAILIAADEDTFVIDFEFSSCAVLAKDHFEDFIYELERINNTFKVEIIDTKSIGPQKFRVQYRIKDKFHATSEEDGLFQEFLSQRGISFQEYLLYNSCTKDVIMFQFRTWLFERKQTSYKQH